MSGLNGRWKLVAVDNFDAYQKAIGVNDEQRALGNQLLATPGAMEEEFCFTATTGKRTIYAGGQTKGGKEFPLGVEFEAPTLDGRKSKVKVVAESATKVVRYDSYDNGVSGTMTTELVGDELKTVLCAGGVTSVRTMKKA
ncbi:hypothetical protein CAPTEDRAFT_227067 [Capitella teleta]|uniref:Cytosolic fatty-acid binding proteins domain-containing protein n=1 Tax=Capitella teleta TaxID=283909 RepID=R7TID2_CAPTE|nr:hypothetical protein CAPTEDRAFT_227067 [Capitella teleta]|eukprot:ELT93603.1 hypothetical protein CAPTEDRAFT_227067 [Capitella teleta]